MNFRFSKNRSLSRFPRRLLRNAGRYWDYALYPFWDEMNVGVAQDSVYSFTTTSTPEVSQTFISRNATQDDKPTLTLAPTSVVLATPSSSTLNIHWVETPTCHIFRADVPGLRKEDLSIMVEGQNLQISGKRNLEHIPTDVNERIQWETPFVRRLRLPTNVLIEEMSALLDHGVLTLTIPKPQILPSIAWFVPINSSPSQVAIRDWNQREPNRLEPHGFDNRMVPRRSRIESDVSPESVSFKEKDNLTSDGDNILSETHPIAKTFNITQEEGSGPNNPVSKILNIAQEEARGPNTPVSKILNIAQEEGRGPNAQVTLNININTGKVSAEGESSSISITPANEGEQPYLGTTSSRSRSISPPSILKQRSSLAQIEENKDKSGDSLPLALKPRSSIHIEDQGDANLNLSPLPSASQRKSSIQIEDKGNEDLGPPLSPPTLKGRPSIQTQDLGDEDSDPSLLDPSLVPTQRGSQVVKALNLGRRKTDGDALQASPNIVPLVNRRKTVGDTSDQNDDMLLQTNIEDGDSVAQDFFNLRKSQLKRRMEESTPNNTLEQFEGRKPSKFEQRGSLQRRKTGGDVAFTTPEEVDSPQTSAKRESMSIARQPSMVENDEEEVTSKLEGFAPNERRRSSKRGSTNSKGKKESSIKGSPDEGEGASTSDGPSINERRRSTKRGSKLQERRESSRDSSSEIAEGPSSNDRRRSTKQGSNSMGRRESIKESSPESLRRQLGKGSFALFDDVERRPSIEGGRRASSKRLSRLAKRESNKNNLLRSSGSYENEVDTEEQEI